MSSRFSSSELADWSGGSWASVAPDYCSGVSKDTRTIERGNLYVALRGENFDGHDYVAEAFKRGAAACLVDRFVPVQDMEGSQLIVGDTLDGLQATAVGYRRTLNATVVGVTGTSGKSTVKELTACLLGGLGNTAKTLGNYNNHIGVPMSILAAARDVSSAVFELGMNNPGELAPLCELVRPDIAIVTNVGAGHLGQFSGVEEIADEKSSLLKAVSPDGFSVLHRDDPYIGVLREALIGEVFEVGMGEGAALSCPEYDFESAVLVERISGDREVLPLPQPGRHNVLNLMMAVVVARSQGATWAGMRRSLSTYSPMDMRWQKHEINGVTVINDAYNANPDSMRAAISTFLEMPEIESKWLVLGGMLELGSSSEGEHKALGEWLAELPFGGIIAVGDCGSWIADGLSGFCGKTFRCGSVEEAGAQILDSVVSGDGILLKGSRSVGLERVLVQLMPKATEL